MSDLYLVLRSRLATVPDWVFIDTSTLEQARKRKGYSYETTARELHVSSKTWERYEKAGRVPRGLLPRIAELLELEIEEPARARISATAGGSQLDRIEEAIARVELRLRVLVPDEQVAALEAAQDEASAALHVFDDGQGGAAHSRRA